jgi:hypothetical protein
LFFPNSPTWPSELQHDPEAIFSLLRTHLRPHDLDPFQAPSVTFTIFLSLLAG